MFHEKRITAPMIAATIESEFGDPNSKTFSFSEFETDTAEMPIDIQLGELKYFMDIDGGRAFTGLNDGF